MTVGDSCAACYPFIDQPIQPQCNVELPENIPAGCLVRRRGEIEQADISRDDTNAASLSKIRPRCLFRYMVFCMKPVWSLSGTSCWHHLVFTGRKIRGCSAGFAGPWGQPTSEQSHEYVKIPKNHTYQHMAALLTGSVFEKKGYFFVYMPSIHVNTGELSVFFPQSQKQMPNRTPSSVCTSQGFNRWPLLLCSCPESSWNLLRSGQLQTAGQ